MGTTPATKVCPDCAETVKAQAHVCRFCGYRFDAAVVTIRPSAAETIFSRPADRRSWFLLWGLASALLIVFASAGPWVRVGGFGGGIVERRGGGLLLLAAAVAGAVLLVVWQQRRAAGIAALVIGLVGVVVTVHDRRHLLGLLRAGGRPGIQFFAPGFVHAGWGLNLAMVASISLALCGLCWLLVLRDPPQNPRLVDVPPSAV